MPSSRSGNLRQNQQLERIVGFEGLVPQDLELCNLDRSFAEQVALLEPLIYPKGWSPALVHAEFEKKISFRPSLLYGTEVAAYSFNYILDEELHILNIAVRPELQGRGFGSYLLKELLELAQRRGVRYSFLEVRKSNVRAQDLYYKHGFVANGIRREYYSDNLEDAVLMERRLDQE